MEPSSEYGDYDRLFYAFSQIYSDAGLAVDLLTEVLERRQKWPNARVLLSIAQSHRAIESDDITLVESALDNANEAERVIGNNPLLMVAKLWARCVALQLAREHGQPTESIICEADLLARSLEQYKDAWSWSLVCAFYFHLVHDTDREKEAWKYVSGGASAAGRFAFLYQVGEKSMVLQPAASDIDKQPLAYVVKACFMALSGDRQNAKDMYRRLSGPERSLSVRTDAILILVLLREFELARTESKHLLDIGGYDSPWWMNRPRLKFLASLNSQEAADELLASAAGVRTLTDDSAIRGSSLMVAVQTDDLHVLVPLESV